MPAIGQLAGKAVQWITVNGRRFPILAKAAGGSVAGGIHRLAKGFKGYPGNLKQFNKQWAGANRAKMQAFKSVLQKQVRASKSVGQSAGRPGVLKRVGKGIGGAVKGGWKRLGTVGKVGVGLAAPMAAWMAADYASDRIRRDLDPNYVSAYDQQAAYRPKRKLYINPMQALVPGFGQGLQGNYSGYAYSEGLPYRQVRDEVDDIFGNRLDEDERKALANLIENTIQGYNGDEVAIMANPEGFMHDYDFRTGKREFSDNQDVQWTTVRGRRIPIKKKGGYIAGAAGKVGALGGLFGGAIGGISRGRRGALIGGAIGAGLGGLLGAKEAQGDIYRAEWLKRLQNSENEFYRKNPGVDLEDYSRWAGQKDFKGYNTPRDIAQFKKESTVARKKYLASPEGKAIQSKSRAPRDFLRDFKQQNQNSQAIKASELLQFVDYKPSDKLIWVTYEGRRFPIRNKTAQVERRRFEKTVHRAIKSERHRERIQSFKNRVRSIVKDPEMQSNAIIGGGLLVTMLLLRKIGPKVPNAARLNVKRSLAAAEQAVQQQAGLLRPGKTIMKQVTKGTVDIRAAKGKWIWSIPDKLKRRLARAKKTRAKITQVKEVVVPMKKEAKATVVEKIKKAVKTQKEKLTNAEKVEKPASIKPVLKHEKPPEVAKAEIKERLKKQIAKKVPKAEVAKEISKTASAKPSNRVEIGDRRDTNISRTASKAENLKEIKDKGIVVKELAPGEFHKSSAARKDADLFRVRVAEHRTKLIDEAKKIRQDMGNKLLQVKDASMQVKKKKIYAEAMEIKAKADAAEAKALQIKRDVLEEMDHDARKGNFIVDKYKAKLREITGETAPAKPAMTRLKIEPIPKAKKAKIEKKPFGKDKPLFQRSEEQIRKDQEYLEWSKKKLAQMNAEEKATAAAMRASKVELAKMELPAAKKEVKIGALIKKKIRGKKK